MNIFTNLKIIILISWSLLLPSMIAAQTATEIIQKATNHFKGNTNQAELTMKIVRPEWTREISIKSWSKGEEYGAVLVTAPARDKGTVFLKHGKEIWNWVPAIERTVKLPPSMMSQSWMGSDFSNDDLVKESSQVSDYTHLLSGTETINATACFKIELKPKPESAVVWGKIITWISKDNFLQLKTEFYDEEDELVNTLNASVVKLMDGKMIPTHLEMIPAGKTGTKTIMDYSLILYNKPIDDSFFTLQNVKNIR